MAMQPLHELTRVYTILDDGTLRETAQTRARTCLIQLSVPGISAISMSCKVSEQSGHMAQTISTCAFSAASFYRAI